MSGDSTSKERTWKRIAPVARVVLDRTLKRKLHLLATEAAAVLGACKAISYWSFPAALLIGCAVVILAVELRA